MVNRISETIKQLFPDDFEELKPVKRPLWERIDYQRLLSGWRVYALGLVLVGIVAAGVYYWNFFLILDYEVTVEGHQVEVALQRRKEVLENLSKKVGEYAAYESQVFKATAQERTDVNPLAKQRLEELVKQGKAAGDAAKVDGAQLGHFLGDFFAVIEGYPQLKLNENFQLLMKALIAAERDLVGHRMAYNKMKCRHCCKLDEFPAWLFANFAFGLERYDYAPVDKDIHLLVPVDTRKNINFFQRDKYKEKAVQGGYHG